MYRPHGRYDIRSPPPMARDCCIVTITVAPSGKCKLSVDIGDRQTDGRTTHRLKPLPIRGAVEAETVHDLSNRVTFNDLN